MPNSTRKKREEERGLRRTYARGFVWRIKNRHIGFTFPYLRDHKPSCSLSPPAAIRQVQQRASLRSMGWRDNAAGVRTDSDLTKGSEYICEKRTSCKHAGINKFQSKLHSRARARPMCTADARDLWDSAPVTNSRTRASASLDKRERSGDAPRERHHVYLLSAAAEGSGQAPDNIP